MGLFGITAKASLLGSLISMGMALITLPRELLALRDGMILCHALAISSLIIESDSSLVVEAIRLGRLHSRKLTYVFRQCLNLYSVEFEIVHGYRQKNVVADCLADMPHRHKVRIKVYHASELPREARWAYIADYIGLWNFRR